MSDDPWVVVRGAVLVDNDRAEHVADVWNCAASTRVRASTSGRRRRQPGWTWRSRAARAPRPASAATPQPGGVLDRPSAAPARARPPATAARAVREAGRAHPGELFRGPLV